ncbi:Uncharacterised protein [Klebsiella aerogenes]|nr:Uncharacterised protein [Klebsiella aerogenes]
MVAAGVAQQWLQRSVSLIEIGDAGMAVEMECRRGGRHHRQVDKPGNGHGDRHIPAGRVIAFFPRTAVQMLGKRGM